MTDDDIARLRGLAQAAPKGPWDLLDAPSDAEPHLWTIVTADGLWTARAPIVAFHKLVPEARALQAAAGRYIAAASPDVLLRILDERDAAMALLRTALAALDDAADRVYCEGDDDKIGLARKAIRAILGGDKGA